MNSNLLVSESELYAAKILVIDDEEAYVRTIEWALRHAKFVNHRSLMDSTRVRDVFTEYRPDLVMLDLNMPVVDGFGVLQQLRELETPGEFLPVLMLTGEGSAEVRTRVLAAGASDFLNKPVDVTTLVLRISNALQTRFLLRKIHTLQMQVEALAGGVKNT